MALFDSAVFAPQNYAGMGGLLGNILKMAQANPAPSPGFEQTQDMSARSQEPLSPQNPFAARANFMPQQPMQQPMTPQQPAPLLGSSGIGGLGSTLGGLLSFIAPRHTAGLRQQQALDIQQQALNSSYQALRSSGVPDATARAAALNPEILKTIAPEYFGGGQKVVPYGSVVINSKGQEVFSNNSGASQLDQPTLEAMARQYRAGDTTVMQNLGRGAQGAQNIVALRAEIAKQNAQAGISGEEQAIKNAEFFGVKSGQRTLGNRQANIEMASTELKQLTPIVLAASDGVDRTNYPTLNSLMQAFEKGTGDPNVVKLGSAVNTYINIYSRAISPTGHPTVNDKEHAREILSQAWAKGQFNAAVDMMQQEVNAALASPDLVKFDARKRFLGGQGPVGSEPPSAVPAPAAPKIKKYNPATGKLE